MANPTWSNVQLLLHCDGSDESTTITDSSPYGHTISVSAAAQLDTAEKKFGTAGLLFPDYYGSIETTVSSALGTSDWAFECWVYLDSTTNGHLLFSTNPTNYDERTEVSISSSRTLGVRHYNTDTTAVETYYSSSAVSAATWTHIAVTKEGSSIRAFIAGNLQFTRTNADFNDTSADWAIWGWPNTGTNTFHVDELRATVGQALYTDSFTPPTEPFPEGETTAISPSRGFVIVTGKAPSVWPQIVRPAAGAISVSGKTPRVSQHYAVAITIQINENAVFSRTAVIEIKGTETYNVTAAIEISAQTYTVTAAIRVSGEETYSVSAGIAIQGSAHTAANRQSIKWSPVVAIDGADVSARVTAACPVEMNEDASNVATVTLIPAAGALEPLSYLGKTLTVTWSDEGDDTYLANAVLMFTGTISDSSWDPDSGLLQIEATSDMQGLVERMDRDSIATMIPGSTWSDIIFEQEADLWQYAQDRLSTTTDSLWQDAMGALRIAPLAAKATADFTFTDSGRFSDTLQISTASIRDLVNEITIALDFRWKRKRHRQIQVRWIGMQDVCTFLGNPYTLCTRDMVQAAANGASWSVVGDISYTDVWPAGAYQCGGGINGISVWGYDPIVAQLDSKQDLGIYTMGATWRAARRYVQTVTETHTTIVQCQDSIDAVGRLPKAEDYGAESDVDTSDWDQTDASVGPPAGAVQLGSGDWAIDTDDEGDVDRDVVDDALEVAMAAARGDILRSHRQTRVSFQTVFQPMLNLSHTVRVNADNLQATGKVSRLEHVLDSATGEATSMVEIAVSRHEGTGLSVSDAIVAPDKPVPVDGSAIPTTLLLQQFTGGSVADYLNPGFEGDEYSEIEGQSGFFTNVEFDELSQTRIGTDQPNPILAKHIYPVQFVVNYPEITGTHIDAAETAATETLEVAVPEDELVCTQ
jgi:hypothetical protein